MLFIGSDHLAERLHAGVGEEPEGCGEGEPVERDRRAVRRRLPVHAHERARLRPPYARAFRRVRHGQRKRDEVRALRAAVAVRVPLLLQHADVGGRLKLEVEDGIEGELLGRLGETHGGGMRVGGRRDHVGDHLVKGVAAVDSWLVAWSMSPLSSQFSLSATNLRIRFCGSIKYSVEWFHRLIQ